jgi:outer membrane protein OmpA-like peptidoglycan-associated protein
MLIRLSVLGMLLCAGSADAAEAQVPLVPGLAVTTAIAERDGDYESRKVLTGHEGGVWRISYSASFPGAEGKPVSLSSERLLHDADLASARTYRNVFESDVEEDYPGTTALGASKEVLRELHEGGSARFALVGESRWISKALADTAADDASLLMLAEGLTRNNNLSFKGELKMQSLGSLSVLVNGQPQSLPVLIASGSFTAKNGHTMSAELSFLDDANNPIALQWRIGNSSLRVVRVDYPVPQNALVRTLKQQQRVTLPGLYFDFGSSTLRAESAAALPRIVEAIRLTEGALQLEGHTDSIGNDQANLALSQARAQAVRSALIALDANIATRLAVQGFGESRPQASNTTLEGRAQNRRVELAIH